MVNYVQVVRENIENSFYFLTFSFAVAPVSSLGTVAIFHQITGEGNSHSCVSVRINCSIGFPNDSLIED